MSSKKRVNKHDDSEERRAEKAKELISALNNKLERKRANIDQYAEKEFLDFKLNLLRALNNACNEDDNYCVFALKIKRDNKAINYMNGYVISLKNIDTTIFKNDHKAMMRQWVNLVLKEVVGMYVSDQYESDDVFTINIAADHHINRRVVHF